MGKKIFVSYKHNDNNVEQLYGYYNRTARDYVDYLINNPLNDEIYKGEGNEDLSQFKDGTIENRLKDKIHDSSVTLVLISPNMKDSSAERDQWIPWEISYSLKEITRQDKTSHTNAIIAVVLPDMYGSYSYYLNQCNKSYDCNTRNCNVNNLFQILKDNMFNYKYINSNNETYKRDCQKCGLSISYGDYSYIQSVKWGDFISNKNFYLEQAIKIRDNRNQYEITKEIK